MSGELARAFVSGLQGEDTRYIMTNAGCKHFAVYAGPENIPENRHSFDAKVKHVKQIVDVRVTYIRKLAILGNREALVTANYSSVFCSYLWGPLDLNP